jgi:hypothetical protein
MIRANSASAIEIWVFCFLKWFSQLRVTPSEAEHLRVNYSLDVSNHIK